MAVGDLDGGDRVSPGGAAHQVEEIAVPVVRIFNARGGRSRCGQGGSSLGHSITLAVARARSYGVDPEWTRQRELGDRVQAHLDGEGDGIRVEHLATGWSGNWAKTLDDALSAAKRRDAVVLLRFMRTELGRSLRAGLDRPWVSCPRVGAQQAARMVRKAAVWAGRRSAASRRGVWRNPSWGRGGNTSMWGIGSTGTGGSGPGEAGPARRPDHPGRSPRRQHRAPPFPAHPLQAGVQQPLRQLQVLGAPEAEGGPATP